MNSGNHPLEAGCSVNNFLKFISSLQSGEAQLFVAFCGYTSVLLYRDATRVYISDSVRVSSQTDL